MPKPRRCERDALNRSVGPGPKALVRYLVPVGLAASWQYVSGVPELQHLSAIGELQSARLVLSSVADVVSPQLKDLAHVPFFSLLAVSIVWSQEVHATSLRVRALVGLCAAALFGAVNEWSQLYVPGRFGSVGDVLYDVAGASIGCLAYWWFTTRRSAASQEPRGSRAER